MENILHGTKTSKTTSQILAIKTRNPENAQRWQQTIMAWRESGQSQVTHCRDHRLNRDTFKYWKRRIEAGDASAGNVSLIRVAEVAVRKASPREIGMLSEAISLMINERYRFEIGNAFTSGTLKRLLDVLEGR